MDNETNCKCIICKKKKKKKKKRLNACSVLFSRNGVYTLSFIHMLTFFHTYGSVKCYNISVNVVVVYLCTLMPE